MAGESDRHTAFEEDQKEMQKGTERSFGPTCLALKSRPPSLLSSSSPDLASPQHPLLSLSLHHAALDPFLTRASLPRSEGLSSQCRPSQQRLSPPLDHAGRARPTLSGYSVRWRALPCRCVRSPCGEGAGPCFDTQAAYTVGACHPLDTGQSSAYLPGLWAG
uniref:Uncharacterized protein n=1 Tax=Chromera velia CCMP2878 TaxID=1169474 RepID=A0A0G4FI02_9ALVE|eukprot:Cvel_17102.t1-p1 / transcript=Cvel_17102.t1 / gene=Cvel_17102 / organism=Chromera_velia_CCMP2878 / gene_product=hypothetical protein / transcript_product=hypothetical protein / location=Cvel_scaffold1348:38809-39291(+) / protein_length=161 / sequence_SO=supercontig / SO=protein_coding / is_pseudo=false